MWVDRKRGMIYSNSSSFSSISKTVSASLIGAGYTTEPWVHMCNKPCACMCLERVLASTWGFDIPDVKRGDVSAK